MPTRPLEIVTHSRLSCFKTCPRKHYLSYELGIRRLDIGQPLRVGTAVHYGVECLANNVPIDGICNAIRAEYDEVPRWADPLEWNCECELAVRLVMAYHWVYQNSPVKTIATEKTFGFKATQLRGIAVAGKVDAIVQLDDGRVAVREMKTTGDSIDDGSDYWIKLRRDQQISLYMIAAQKMGYAVETVLYDVIRKPGCTPYRATPMDKRKYKKDGTLYANQRDRDETVDEYGQRVTDAIVADPGAYFVRREIPRLDSDLETFRRELVQTVQQLRNAQRNGYWYRNTNSCTMPYRCEYHSELCDMDIQPDSPLSAGWRRTTNIHEELDLAAVNAATAATQTKRAPRKRNIVANDAVSHDAGSPSSAASGA